MKKFIRLQTGHLDKYHINKIFALIKQEFHATL